MSLVPIGNLLATLRPSTSACLSLPNRRPIYGLLQEKLSPHSLQILTAYLWA